MRSDAGRAGILCGADAIVRSAIAAGADSPAREVRQDFR